MACNRRTFPRVSPLTLSAGGPDAVHSSWRASFPPSTDEGLAPSAFDHGEVGTGLVQMSDPPPLMVGLLTLLGLSTQICSELAFEGPLMLDCALVVGANGTDCTALPTGAAARVGAGSTARRKMDPSSSSSYSSPELFWRSDWISSDSSLLASVSTSTDSIS